MSNEKYVSERVVNIADLIRIIAEVRYITARTRTFQRNHGLTVDGIVGKDSWKVGLESV